MAHVKKNVARAMHRGDNVREILTGWNKKSEVAKAFLWWCWFKGASWGIKLWGVLRTLLLILLWVGILIAGAVITFVVTAVVVVTSPLWLPIRLRYAAPKVAKLLLDTEFDKLKNPEDLPFFIMDGIWTIGCLVLNFVWRPVYNRLPMVYRQWFIKEDAEPLSSYEAQTQLEYYNVQSKENKVEAIRHMGRKAMRQLWNGGKVADRENLLQVYSLDECSGNLLLTGGEEMFELLLRYCADEEKKLSPKLQLVLVDALNGEHQERAISVLRVCSESHKLDKTTLIALIELWGSNVGEQVEEILSLYWGKNTLSNEVVKALIEASTDDFVDETKTRAYDLLLKVVRRDGLSTELAELFFAHCDSVQNERMSEIFDTRMDCDEVSYSYANDENRKKWENYCSLKEHISVEAQLYMKEWQYDIFRSFGHTLGEAAIYELLVKRLSKDDVSYFKKVLDEEVDRNTLSDTAFKLLLATPWKRDIVLMLAEKEKNAGIKLSFEP